MKTMIITGASRGIGAAIARYYGERGWNLVLNCAHSAEQMKELAGELSKITPTVYYIGDISSEETARELSNLAIKTFGGIDLVINNAGISYVGLLTDMSYKEWQQLIHTNLDSVYLMSREVIPHMVHRKCGKILNISSVWGEVGASCEAAYSASKGAVNALTKALAKELAPSGISVNAISFGCIDTQMNHCFSEEERAALAEEIPCGRFASPAEAAAFCYQITESPSYLTGQVLRFDGGWI